MAMRGVLAAVAATWMGLGCTARDHAVDPAAAQSAYLDLAKRADQAMSRGDRAEAKRLYSQGLAQAEKLTEKAPQLVDPWLDTGLFYRRLGEIAEAEGNLPVALHLFTRYVAVATVVTEVAPSSVRARDTLWTAYNRAGEFALRTGKPDAAKKLFMDQFKQTTYDPVAIAARLKTEPTDTPEQRSNLRIMYRRLGEIARADGDFQAATEYFELARGLL